MENVHVFTHSSAADQVVLVCDGTGESEDSRGWCGSPNNPNCEIVRAVVGTVGWLSAGTIALDPRQTPVSSQGIKVS